MQIGYTLTGFLVGAIVGLTGVGGGAVMTPVLVLTGIPPAMAVGTDLIYAGITKTGAVLLHRRAGTIDWSVVGLLASGSLPATLLAVGLLARLKAQGVNYEPLITAMLSAGLLVSALILLTKGLRPLSPVPIPGLKVRRVTRKWLTVAAGALLGTMVSLSSIGAGAMGAAILLLLYPRLPAAKIVGTDLAHAVPLALLAGLGHAGLGFVDFALLGSLLLGSLPGIFIGTSLATRMPERLLRRVLGVLLLVVGLGFALGVAT